MLSNIVDRRKRPFRWKEVNAIVEATCYDNNVVDADQSPEIPFDEGVVFDALEAVSVNEAISWAEQHPLPVTLFLYDLGEGLTDEEE